MDRRRVGIQVTALVGAVGVGMLVEYFVLDRQHAARRRHTVRDRTVSMARRRARASVRRAKYLEGVAEGVAYKAAHTLPGVGGRGEPLDDVALAQKVESTAFRRAHVPKDRVSVNAENGVVFLRGELDDEKQIETLVRVAATVDGVRQVRNMLHTATDAGARADL
jgi:osmotically-inducible protein OsmY